LVRYQNSDISTTTASIDKGSFASYSPPLGAVPQLFTTPLFAL
jgi:hypothetical protein